MSPLLGPAEAYQPSIHVDDAASAIVAALSAPPGAYIVADEPITKGQWNSAFAEAFGIGRRLRPTPKIVLKASRNKVGALAKSWRVSSARFRAATGWEPHYPDARVGLKAVAAEWKAGTGD
jgi:nucleoside-diphosphate-sugar epimerase